MRKTIKELALLLDKVEIIGSQDRDIQEIVHDSRKKGKDFLFICISGATVDGHKFINQAIDNGAVAVLVEKNVIVPEGITVIKVPDVKSAMQVIAPYFYDYPARKMRMIGVTGTNGKTTITYLLQSILRNAGFKVGVIGTIQIMIENEVLPIHNTTPDVIDLQSILSQMVEKGIDYVVMEVSSHALDQNRIAGCEFDVAVFTNLTQDHLDYHKTLDNYANAKAKLFDLVSQPGVKASKAAVINFDDAYGQLMVEHAKCKVITYGIDRECNLLAKEIKLSAKGASLTLSENGKNMVELNLKITGIFNVYNVMAAIGAALVENIEIKIIKEALEHMDGVSGRFEVVDEGQKFSVIVDYAHTPDGLKNVLSTARQIAQKRIITVFGCGGDRDQTKRPIMGKIATELADVVIATSDNPRSEDPEFILSQVEAGVLSALTGDKYHEKITDRKAAIFRAIELADEGDVVVIAGKGHEDYQILKDKTIHFDDKEVAREALRRI